MDIMDFVKAIEPLQATTASASPEDDLRLMSITSMAVSLKRIADAQERMADLAERNQLPVYDGRILIDGRF